MLQQDKVRSRVYRASAASMFIYSASSIALPISLVKISEELGFNLTQGGSLGFVSSIEQFFVLILGTFAAAKWGKVRVLRSALLVLAGGLVFFTLSHSYLTALFLILFIGIGNGFLEALLTPIVEDLYPGDNGSKMNLLHAFWPLGTCASVLILGELLSLSVSWRVLFISIAVLVLIISFYYPSSKKILLPKSRSDLGHIREILSMKRFWYFGMALFFAGGSEGAFAFWSASFIQIHYAALPRAGAIGTACFAIGMAVGRFYSSKLAGKLGLPYIIFASSVLGLLVSASFFFITNLYVLYGFLFCMGLCIACLWPSLQTLAARELPVDPTSLMVFLSCFGIPGLSSIALFMGMLGDTFGLRASFILAPVYLTGLCVFFVLAMYSQGGRSGIRKEIQ